MSFSEWEPVSGETRGSVTALATGGGAAVFAATPVGVFKSLDGGGGWELSGDGSGVAFGEAIAVAGDDVFVGAADGLHHSADGGRTWAHVLAGSRVAAVCAAAGVVLAGTDTDGVLRSDDAGGPWSGVNAGLLDLEVLALCLSPTFATDRLAFAGTASGLYRSRNGGDSWRAVDTGLEDPAVQCIALGRDRLVVAGTENHGLVCSLDGGTTWHQPAELAERSVTALSVAAHGDVAAATDIGVFVSVDHAQSWSLQAGGPDAILALLEVAGVWLAGAEGSGVWRLARETWTESSSGLHASLLSTLVVGADDTLWAAGPTEGVRVWCAGTWQDRNHGLPDATVVGLSVAADGAALAATPHGVYEWRDSAWRLVRAGPVRTISGSKPIVAVAERVIASDDFGQTWRTLSTPFEADAVIAVAAAGALVFATREDAQTVLWRSDDGGAHWQRLLLRATLTALARSPDGRLWVATPNGIYVSHDHGESLVAIDGPKRVIAIAPPYALEPGGRLWRRRDSG